VLLGVFESCMLLRVGVLLVCTCATKQIYSTPLCHENNFFLSRELKNCSEYFRGDCGLRKEPSTKLYLGGCFSTTCTFITSHVAYTWICVET
jgi:hypothetical protein